MTGFVGDLDGIERDLADVEVALARLDAGTYWTDEVTGDQLPAQAEAYKCRKPDGSTTSWPAVASGTTAIRFDTLVGSLDMPGRWLLQAHVTLASGEWLGETVVLDVYGAFA